MSVLGRGRKLDRLRLYNGALELCGERSLADLSEVREPRRLLDDVWDRGGVLRCLAQGQWGFATRTVRLDYDPSLEPEFGYRRGFDQPDDFITTVALCSDESFLTPLLRYTFEAGFWFADCDQIFLSYVSDDEAYGLDWALWSEPFKEFVEAYFAFRIVHRLTQDKERIVLVAKNLKSARLEAKNHDMQQKPTRFPPPGSWTTARTGGRSSGRDGGTLGRLIG